MVRLVYHSRLLGPLHFEYAHPRIRVGSCRDNDLVIPHPSLRPYHCTLALGEDSVTVLPPNAPEKLPPDQAPCFRIGEDLVLGEVVLRIEHSSKSVALPTLEQIQPPDGRTPEGFWKADFGAVPDLACWLCAECGLRFEDAQTRVIGLVGRRRHIHCPICGRNLAWVQPAPPESSRTLRGRLTSLRPRL
jgi:hypothetical protein